MKKLLLFTLCLSGVKAQAQTAWQKNYKISDPAAFTVIENPNTVLQTPDGGYLVGGMFTMANEARRAFLMKIDANGDSVWSKQYPYAEQLNKLYYDNSNDLRGVFEVRISGEGLNNLFIKLDAANGDTISSFRAPKPTNADNYRYRAHVQLPDNSYVLSTRGETAGGGPAPAGYMLRFTPGSNTATWYADSMAQLNMVFNDMILDGQSVVVAGQGNSGGINFLVAKYDVATGAKQWRRIMRYPGGGFLDTHGACLVKNGAGNYVAGGDWHATINSIINITPAFFEVSANGDSLNITDIHLAGTARKIIKSGNNLLAIGHTERDDMAPDNSLLHHTDITLFVLQDNGQLANLTTRYNNTTVNQVGAGYLSTHWAGSGLMTNTAGELLVYGQGAHFPAGNNSSDQNTFIAKLTPNTTGVADMDNDHILTVYPNPVTDVLTIKTSNARGMVMITNSMGQVMQQLEISRANTSINMASWSAGMYFIQYGDAAFSKTLTIVKQ